VPRTKGDGLRGFFWPRTRYGAGEIETYARLLADALNSQTGSLGDI
jgi:histidine triad (HIT) family protein